MTEMDKLSSGESDVSNSVLERIKEKYPDLIQPAFPDLPLSYPDLEIVLDNFDSQTSKELLGTLPILYKYLQSPIIDYPTKQKRDVIDEFDKNILAMFPEKTDYDIAYNLLQNNRMRPNAASRVSSIFYLINDIIQKKYPEKASEIGKIYNLLSPLAKSSLTEFKGFYQKKMSLEEKKRVIKQYSKASEMALRVLGDQEINDEDWEFLRKNRVDKSASE